MRIPESRTGFWPNVKEYATSAGPGQPESQEGGTFPALGTPRSQVLLSTTPGKADPGTRRALR